MFSTTSENMQQQFFSIFLSVEMKDRKREKNVGVAAAQNICEEEETGIH
jgi:hypothetical protein